MWLNPLLASILLQLATAYVRKDRVNFPNISTDPDDFTPTINRTPSEPTNDEHRLITYLLLGQPYRNDVRGVKHANDTIKVRIGATVTHISKIEEKNQVLQVSLYLEQDWFDVRLTWDQEDFGDLSEVNLAHGRVWMPDIVLLNNAENYKEFKPTHVMVYSHGLVTWAPPVQIRSMCRLNLRMFPFDYQKCELKFGSWMHDDAFMDVTPRNRTISFDGYIDNGEWKVMAHTIKRIQERNCQRISRECLVYPRVLITIYLKRRVLFYVFNVIIPCAMLSVLTLMQFWLPSESGEKVTLGLTVLLAFSVFSFNIGESMPEISDVIPLVAIYIMSIMGTSAMSVTLSVIVLNLHHAGSRNQKVPGWLKFLAFRILGPMSFQASDKSRTWSQTHTNSTFDRIFKFVGKLAPQGAKRPPPSSHGMEYAFPPSRRGRGVPGKVQPRENLELASIFVRKRAASMQLSDLLGRAGMLLDKCEGQRESDATAAEWRAVARIFDLFLFWLMLAATICITIGMLVIAPLCQEEPVFE